MNDEIDGEEFFYVLVKVLAFFALALAAAPIGWRLAHWYVAYCKWVGGGL